MCFSNLQIVILNFFRYVLQEMLDTEKDYVNDLGLVVEVTLVVI